MNKVVLLIIFIFCFLLTASLILKIYIDVFFSLNGHESYFEARFYILKGIFLNYKFTLPQQKDKRKKKKNKEKKESGIKETLIHLLKSNIPKARDYLLIFKNHLNRFNIHIFNAEFDLGTGNASTCAILTGGVWGIMGIVEAFLSSSPGYLKNRKIKVKPNYTSDKIKINFHSIISIRLIHTILVIPRLGLLLLKNNKKKYVSGGDFSGRASY